jgi:hypothetical protein
LQLVACRDQGILTSDLISNFVVLILEYSFYGIEGPYGRGIREELRRLAQEMRRKGAGTLGNFIEPILFSGGK